jgi:hypothetical protein
MFTPEGASIWAFGSSSSPTDSGDGPAQPIQLPMVQLVGPAEVVEDFCGGLAGNGVTYVVSQLEVFYYRAVLVATLCGPKIHAYLHRVFITIARLFYRYVCQRVLSTRNWSKLANH